ncbi:hypothetical protein [Saccharothrix xinjiangensis]|uniref:Uncharacterized protein n=1 Tax=Saccharothrix xinjiangensis TaxID=204798 RepID=A0ABV9XT67_9PSEU
MTPVVVDIGARSTGRVVACASATGALGVVALVGAVVAYAGGEAATGAIGLVVGLVLAGIALVAVLNRRAAPRPRELVFEEPGVRWDDPDGTPWAVAWPELGAVRLSRTRERLFHPADSSVRKTRVRFDLLPADPAGFRASHPDLAHLARADGTYRLPLGDSAGVVRAVERGVLGFAPHLWRGVQDEGVATALA